jgi:hypothetical protein
MTAKRWIDDDAGYEEWRSTHPDGYVANTRNTDSRKYFIIHHVKHNFCTF